MPIAMVCHGQSAAWIGRHCLIGDTDSEMVFPDSLNDIGRIKCYLVGQCELQLQRQTENMGMSVSVLRLSSSAWQATVI